MFDSGFADNGGNMLEIKATIAGISAQMKISELDMNKTGIDIKNGYVKSLGNAVLRREDSKVIAALAALSPKVTPTKPTTAVGTECKGIQVADYSTDANAKKIIAEIRKAHAYAKLTPDNHRGLAFIISAEEWAQLSTCNYVLDMDYASVFGGGSNGEPSTFFGAEIIIVDHDTNIGGATKVSYLVPSNSVCFAEFEGSMSGTAEFFATDGRKWHLQAYKSVGVAVAESHVITKISTAAVTA